MSDSDEWKRVQQQDRQRFFKHYLPSHASQLIVSIFKHIASRPTSNRQLIFSIKTSGLSSGANSVLCNTPEVQWHAVFYSVVILTF